MHGTPGARTRLAGWLGEVVGRPSGKIAIALVLAAGLFLLALLESPSRIYWVGRDVPASVEGGVVYYRVDGQDYTIDAPSARVKDGPATVSVSRGDPTEAALDFGFTKWVDGAPVLGCLVVAAGLVTVSSVRRRAARGGGPDQPGPGADGGWLPESIRSRQGPSASPRG